MGKGRTRKPGDQPKIRLAGQNLVNSKTSARGQTPEDVCPAIINAKLKETPLTKEGVGLELKKNGDRYDILISGTVIGTLDLRISRKIMQCSEYGIKYKGTISVEKNEVYGKFKRQT